jgi:hypothetical protein
MRIEFINHLLSSPGSTAMHRKLRCLLSFSVHTQGRMQVNIGSMAVGPHLL